MRKVCLSSQKSSERIAGQKIRLVMIAGGFSINGVSTVIMNYCKNLDRRRYDITIMAGTPINSAYRKECDLSGIHMVELPPKKETPKAYYKSLWKSLSAGYDIVHVHGNSTIIAAELLMAFLRGVKVRVAHCHNTTCNNILIHKLLKPIFNCLYTESFACSMSAGKWLFGKKETYIIPNGFNVTKFRFSKENRYEIRKHLNLENKLLIGHMGRFNEQKNQSFILHIFKKVAEDNSKAYLLLVGDGPDFQKICQLIKEHPYQSRIIVFGETLEAEKLYAAMDIFIFPSKYEGLPVVLLEAQSSGLPCIVSDKVTKEVDFGDICWKSIEEKPEVWAETIAREVEKPVSREEYFDIHKQQIMKYDIQSTVKQLETIYAKACGMY